MSVSNAHSLDDFCGAGHAMSILKYLTVVFKPH